MSRHAAPPSRSNRGDPAGTNISFRATHTRARTRPADPDGQSEATRPNPIDSHSELHAPPGPNLGIPTPGGQSRRSAQSKVATRKKRKKKRTQDAALHCACRPPSCSLLLPLICLLLALSCAALPCRTSPSPCFALPGLAPLSTNVRFSRRARRLGWAAGDAAGPCRPRCWAAGSAARGRDATWGELRKDWPEEGRLG